MTSSLAFGDNVRIRSTAATIAMGLAGVTGTVYGVTRPSSTGVRVIGDVVDDSAFAVKCPGRQDSVWFAAALLEFLDHGAGTEIRLDGVAKKWTQAADGSWIETGTDEAGKRPWWKFNRACLDRGNSPVDLRLANSRLQPTAGGAIMGRLG